MTLTFERGRALARRAQELIPAGCHTYSKGDDQFPLDAPPLIARGSGCRVWDVDGNEFVDWGMGLRSVIVGHAHARVLARVKAELELGSNFTRPSPIELELAERLVSLIPSAQMVKLAKNGSDVTTASLRLARAFTGRDEIAICADHPFFSVHDWFIGTTPVDAGIPKEGRALVHRFRFNDPASLERILTERKGKVAAVMLEPATAQEPRDRFLACVRELCTREGALLIFDEMITGMRFSARGAQHHYGVTPDLSTFGKAIGNGFSVSALVGRRDVMERGGLTSEKPRVFLLSNTHGGETHCIGAALATLDELTAPGATEHLWRIGDSLKHGLNDAARAADVGDLAECVGPGCSPALVIRGTDGAPSMPLRTLFLQETIARGVLIPYIAPSLAHDDAAVARTLDAAADAFRVIKRAAEGDLGTYLRGPAVKPVFRRYNQEPR